MLADCLYTLLAVAGHLDCAIYAGIERAVKGVNSEESQIEIEVSTADDGGEGTEN